jgi:hypothetical protein
MRAPKKKFMTYIPPGGGEVFFSLKKKIYYSIYIYTLSESTFYADHEYDFRNFLSLKFKILGYFLDFFSYMFNLARTALLIPTSLTDI